MVLEQLPVEFNAIRPFLDLILPGIGETFISLLIFTFSMVLYGIVIFHFYLFLAKRDIFSIDVQKYHRETPFVLLTKFFAFFLYFVKYGLIYPVFAFIAFAGLSLLLMFLSKSQPIDQVLLTAIVVVSGSRIASYYNEDLAKDFAKMLPFALLGIAIVDPNFFSFGAVIARFSQIPEFGAKIAQFLIFAILLEWFLRIVLWLKLLVLPKPLIVQKLTAK